MNDEPKQAIHVDLAFYVPAHLTSIDMAKCKEQFENYFRFIFQSEDIPCKFRIDHKFDCEVK